MINLGHDPSDPSYQNDPNDPNDPIGPNDPSDPNDPNDPSDPNDPNDPFSITLVLGSNSDSYGNSSFLYSQACDHLSFMPCPLLPGAFCFGILKNGIYYEVS